ncbi:TM2 domain-containing protein CG11103 [Galendromus occidentalis]|uniref:TM2 domain-containing protein CG11103 n=1 Tax=Galendromus occidentalis TaxID=34638 RepID=A0AAJ6QWT6_9ACAR|nr:TM2 domain-containing protein CG11103 [Galendromus occidentalis]
MELDFRWEFVIVFVMYFYGVSSQSQCHLNISAPYVSHSPLVPCEFLPMDFLECSDPIDLRGNDTAREELKYGCSRWGGNRYEEVQMSAVNCTVLPNIECYGNRTFQKEGFPCIKYTGHYFTTTFLYSLLLGFLGMDRFCLGHTGTAVGKLLTVGGVGIWWVVDIILLATGNLMPEDGSNWMPYV